MRNVLDELKAHPSDYVSNLKSPIGVYLRRSVLDKKQKTDVSLRKKLYRKVTSGQSNDGSWNGLFVDTANNLWDLGLLGYGAKDENVKKGLDWILGTQKHTYRGYPGFFYPDNRKDPSTMRSTLYGEFGPGCTIFYTTPYAVHLYHMFGLDVNKKVQQAVDSYLKFWTPDWCGAWCTINVLGMLIEHPKSTNTKRVRAGIESLADIQTKTGAWKGFPFYHTFHALSRSKNRRAKKQLDNALPSIIRRQNKDGSWGKKKQENTTYLALDALKNVGLL
jgi:squalene cyclase